MSKEKESYGLDETLARAIERATRVAGRVYGIGGIGPLVHVDIAPRAVIVGVRFGMPATSDRR